jgi:DNA-binding SARP family transcriptional activator/tetratricopeptide (TPR) repeat protein
MDEVDRGGIRVALFGRVAAWRGSQELALGPARQRAVFALLVLAGGRPVARGELIAALWGDEPPAHAVNVIQTHVKHLRRALDPGRAARQASEVLPRAGDGYSLRIDPESIDLQRFRRFMGLARSARREGDHGRVAGLVEAALRMAVAPPLVDLPLLAAHPWVTGVAGERGMVATWLAEAAIARGEALAAMEDAAATRPLDESVCGWLIRVYYAVGRRADALAAFEGIRRRLAERLGVDPAPELRALHQAVLRDELGTVGRAAGSVDEVAAAPPEPAPPPSWRCLPRDIDDFTGRDTVLRQLLEVLGTEGQPVAAPAIVAVDGMAGVGKTALAVHLAHLVADRFPDAQLSVDLRGHSSQLPLPPLAALEMLLRQVGVPGDQIPPGLEARGALWRSLSVGRRMLLLLDNAVGSEQVAPLLPAGADCLTLITSRVRLAGLDGVRSLSLDVLDPPDAVALLRQVVGPRITADPVGAALVARRCGYLALALRLVAARLMHRPGWTVRDLMNRLDTARPALNQIVAENRSMIAAFALSYDHLDEPAAGMFRMLGLHPGPDIDVYAAAALAGLDHEEADSLLTELVDAHLVEEPAAGRYQLHGLLREYAHGLVEAIATPAQRRDAVRRLLDFYLHSAVAAGAVTDPVGEFDFRLAELGGQPSLPVREYSFDSAMAWFRGERANLLACVRLADTDGWPEHCWRLGRTVWTFTYCDGYNDDSLSVMRAVLDSAQRTGDRAAESLGHNYLAGSLHRYGQWDEALHHLDRAIDIRRETGDQIGLVLSLKNRGVVLCRAERYHEALESLRDSQRQAEGLREDTGTLTLGAFLDLATVSTVIGDFATAEASCRRYLELVDRFGSEEHRAYGFSHLGNLQRRRGRSAEAVELLERAIPMLKKSDVFLRAEATWQLGSAYRDCGRLDDALHSHLQALSMMQQSQSPYGEAEARNELGRTLYLRGMPNAASEQYCAVLDIAGRAGIRLERAQALDGIADTLDGSDPAEARRLRHEASALYARLGIPRPAPAPGPLSAPTPAPLSAPIPAPVPAPVPMAVRVPNG